MTYKIIHLSDLHFGTEIPGIVAPLLADIVDQHPDLIIISGDMTQRALTYQFKIARDFVAKLNQFPMLCIPGNHDISMHNLIERFFYPMKKYQRYITKNLSPEYVDNRMAILGVNSATPYKLTSGFITNEQLETICSFFNKQDHKKLKILIMHHNLIKSERHKIINDSERIISAFAACSINIVLSGHIHAPLIEKLKNNYLLYNMYIITAGTATSHRTVLPNSYNVIKVDETEFKLEVREFAKGEFSLATEQTYKI